jgi:hypothetical protein
LLLLPRPEGVFVKIFGRGVVVHELILLWLWPPPFSERFLLFWRDFHVGDFLFEASVFEDVADFFGVHLGDVEHLDLVAVEVEKDQTWVAVWGENGD